MAKRFTDTEKWKKPFIRNLKAPYKLLWFYILDECDYAGLWQVDFDVARLKIGEKLNEQDAINFFTGKISVLENGEKWFIPSFIEFQYGKLAENNRAHTKAISALLKLKLLNENLDVIPLQTNPKPLASPLFGAKDKEEVKDKVTEEEKDKSEQQTFFVVMPFTSEQFVSAWNIWKDYKLQVKKFKYASATTEQAALKSLIKLSEGREQQSIDLIEYAIGRQWDGFYPISENKNNSNGTKQTSGNPNAAYAADLARRMAEDT